MEVERRHPIVGVVGVEEERTIKMQIVLYMALGTGRGTWRGIGRSGANPRSKKHEKHSQEVRSPTHWSE